MKVQLFAPTTVVAVLLALTSYSVRIDNSVRNLFGYPAVDVSSADSDAGRNGLAPQPASNADQALPLSTDPSTAPQPLAATSDAAEAAEEAQDTPAANPTVLRTVTIESGDTIGGVLKQADVTADEAQLVKDALERVLSPRDLRAGQTWSLTFQKQDGQLHLASLDMAPDVQRSISVTAHDDGSYTAREIKSRLSVVERAGTGTVDGSLYEAAAQARIPQATLATFIRAYSYNVDFQRELQPGDKFAILYEAVVNDRGDLVRPGNILAAFLKLGNRAQKIYLNKTAEGSLEFFSPDGKGIRRSLLRTPVSAVRITSGFGMRIHPLLGYSKMHKGVDFGAPPGTPVFAAGDGVIERMGWWGGYGKYMRIRHGNDMATAYGHLSRFNPALQEGSRVRQGQIIALTGSTGASTGPHLHFEVLKHGIQVNPLTVTDSIGNVLDGKEMAAFRRLMEIRDVQMRELIQPTQVAVRNVITAGKVE